METAAGMYQMQLSREARWKAGRLGMPDLCVASSTTEYGNLGAFGAPGGADPDLDVALILAPGELTTSFEVLHKVIHAINCGAKLTNGFSSMIGGFPGPPEGAAVVRIATILQQTAYHQTPPQTAYHRISLRIARHQLPHFRVSLFLLPKANRAK